MFLLRGIGPAATATTFLLMGLSAPAEAPTSLQVRHITFQKTPTSTGVQEVTGVPFRGAALLIWTDRQEAPGVTDGAPMCIGMTDGVTQITRAINLPDNEAATTSAQAERTNRLVYLTTATSGATPTVQVEGQFVSFTPTGFRINWLTNDADETLFHCLVLGGLQAHLAGVKIDVDAPNTKTVTGLPFTPESFIVHGGASDIFGTDYNLGAPFGSFHGFGFSNAVQNICGWTLGMGTGGAADNRRGQHTDRVASIRIANVSGAADACSIQITGIAANQFTITRTVGTGPIQPVQHILCLAGAQFTMGAIDTPALPGPVSIAVSSRPHAVLLQTHGAAVAETTGLGLAVGAWDRGGGQGGTWIGGTNGANPSVYARASYTDATLKSYTPAATGSASVLACEASVASASASAVVVEFDTVPASPIAVLYLIVARGSAPIPGGEVPEGVDPAVSDLPTGIIRLFAEWTYGTSEPYSTLSVAETVLRNPASWHGGFMPAWLLEVSDIERTLAPDLRGVLVTLVVADPGGLTFRALAEIQNLNGSVWEIFTVSDSVRYALGEPHRRFAGRVAGHRALPGFRYEFSLVDILSEDLGLLLDAARVPPSKLTLAQFPGMTADYEGRALPIPLGEVSDEDAPIPQGVVPPMIVAPSFNLSALGGINVEVVAAVIAHGALPPRGLWEPYYNPAGQPYARIPVPAGAEGTIVTWPGAAGWSFVGVPTDYVDFPLPLSALTNRLTPVFFLKSHPAVQDWVDGKSQLAFNLFGLTEFADGSGRYWSDAPDTIEFLVRNFLKPPLWQTGDYNEIQTFFRGYSIVNLDSVATSRARLRAFGGGTYPIGFLLGGDGRQQSMRQVIADLLDGVLMEIGIDRHGRYMFDVEDPDAEATWSLSDLHDIELGSFEVDHDWKSYRNHAEYRGGIRYLPAVAPIAAPAEGDPLPAVNLGPHQDWQTIGAYEHTEAIAANRGIKTVPLQLDNRVVRKSDVLANWAQRKVARAVGPGPGYNGPQLPRMVTTWRTGALNVELGDVVAVTHIEGVASGGWVGKRFRVERIVDRLQARRIEFSGRILPDPEES
jgi:hypothetical protein